ncbi:MAG: SEL1-like repeat protein [Alphaproteobacteria bacterium]|nr:SEL1-like repeat protein [Alphaproteobacteria bacterium]
MIALLTLAFAQDARPGLAEFTAALVLDFHEDGIHADDAAVDAAYAKACEAGEQLACDRPWRPGELQSARTALEASCGAGHPASCLAVGWSKAQITPGIYHQEAPEASDAMRFFETACTAGLERGCVEKGALLQLGVGVEKDEAAALAMHQTACQQGEMAGCRRMGALYHAGLGVKRDLDKAREYYAKACDAGYLGGCNSLGLLAHLSIDGRKPDPPAAVALYIRACDGGHEAACNNLEKLYAAGMRAEEDPPGRLALWEAGCERGVAVACANGADLVEAELMGDARDTAKAKALREKGCDLDDPYSCGMLGKSMLPEDFDKGRELLRTACESGIGEACTILGDALGAKGARYDAVRSASLHAKGCELGQAASCNALANAHWKGAGVDKDKERARELYGTACAKGIEEACKRAPKL